MNHEQRRPRTRTPSIRFPKCWSCSSRVPGGHHSTLKRPVGSIQHLLSNCLITSRFTMLTPAAAWPMRSCYFKMGNLSLTHKSCTQLTSVRCSVCRFGGMIVCTVHVLIGTKFWKFAAAHFLRCLSDVQRSIPMCAGHNLHSFASLPFLFYFLLLYSFNLQMMYGWQLARQNNKWRNESSKLWWCWFLCTNAKMKMCNRTKWRESEDAAAAFLLVNIFLFCFLYFSTAWVPSDRVKPLVELDAFSTMNTYV